MSVLTQQPAGNNRKAHSNAAVKRDHASNQHFHLGLRLLLAGLQEILQEDPRVCQLHFCGDAASDPVLDALNAAGFFVVAKQFSHL